MRRTILNDPRYYLNRHVQWMDFNQRVLEEARDAGIFTNEWRYCFRSKIRNCGGGLWTRFCQRIWPQISFIGKTEEQLTQEDVPYEVGVAYYREIAKGQITAQTEGRLKLLFHRQTLELLGVHIYGEEAAELLHIGQAVFTLKGKVSYFVDTVF